MTRTPNRFSYNRLKDLWPILIANNYPCDYHGFAEVVAFETIIKSNYNARHFSALRTQLEESTVC